MIHYDKRRVAQYFGRAADSYIDNDRLQRGIADHLLQHLRKITGGTQSVLDVGCGPAHHQSALEQLGQHYIGIDLAPQMLAKAQSNSDPHQSLIVADMEHLPLARSSIGILFSNLAMQWGNDIAALLCDWYRVLAPGGQVAASTVLAGSLQPLGDCFAALDGRPHTNQWLSFACFAKHVRSLPWQVHCQQHHVVQEFPTVEAMLRELKGVGANYTVRESSGLFSRARYRKLQEALEGYRNANGMLELHWEIGTFYGLKQVEES
ncbi:methyltransferase domain-containing protein [Pseudidiomarina sp.]|uniref:methyltransferase domain-containing protein n=1 Tax=Pseudidiomarina sp. TaxID=2081707 RepID=UPI003A9810E0